MIRSMYSGVSGLQAHGVAIDVVADNIANVNTPGFKAARAQFQALVSQTLRGASSPTSGGQNPAQVGLGVTIGGIERQMGQGSLQTTGRSSDLAIEGNGFFVLSNNGSARYTRNGAFGVDGSRTLVDSASGAAVMGWASDTAGSIDTSQPPTRLSLPAAGQTMARASTRLLLGGNLNAAANVGDTATTQVRLYDSQGSVQLVSFTFAKTNINEWSWTAADGGGAAIGAGTLTFDANGHPTTGAQTLSIPLTNGAATPMNVSIGFDGVGQLAQASEVVPTMQDGLPPGDFQGFSVTNNGALIGSFSNGLTRQLGQLAMATFSNTAGLERDSGGAFAETANSGVAQVGAAGTGGRGRVIAGSLEMSNADLTREFSTLIMLQRGFQANGRSVTTSDQLLQDILSLKQ